MLSLFRQLVHAGPEAVTDEFDIIINWSAPHPDQAGRKLAEIAADWNVTLLEAARRLQPAGAVYHNMHEDDVRRVLSHPLTMVGSDGLPNDPKPHPRLWGAFPRVLGHYSRDAGLFPLNQAVHKMTGLSAARYGLAGRGLIREGYHADVVLFNPDTVIDRATFADPSRRRPASRRSGSTAPCPIYTGSPPANAPAVGCRAMATCARASRRRPPTL